MKKFCALNFCLLICLMGCKESEKKSQTEQTFRINQEENVIEKAAMKKSFQIPNPNQKKLKDEAQFWELTTLETLDMTLDSTTKDQALDILKSYGYVCKDITKNNIVILSVVLNQLTLFSQDPTKIQIPFPEEALRDKLTKSCIIFAADPTLFQEEKNKLKGIIDPKKEYMVFIFDENKKLIIFFKQYSENKEKGLRTYELTGGSDIVWNSKNHVKSFFRKDLSKAFVGTKDSKATTYCVFSPSIVKDHVDEFRKAMKIAGELKETQELFKMERENFKEIEEEYLKGSIKLEELRKKIQEKRIILNNSKKYKELKAKINEKVYKKLLKNLK